MDTVAVMGIRARGHHGVLDFERQMGQTFVVDVEMVVDTTRAGRTDDLAHTVDYGAVATEVVAIVAGPAGDEGDAVVARGDDDRAGGGGAGAVGDGVAAVDAGDA